MRKEVTNSIRTINPVSLAPFGGALQYVMSHPLGVVKYDLMSGILDDPVRQLVVVWFLLNQCPR